MDNQPVELSCEHINYPEVKQWAESLPDDELVGVIGHSTLCVLAKYTKRLYPQEHIRVSVASNGVIYIIDKDQNEFEPALTCNTDSNLGRVVSKFDGIYKYTPGVIMDGNGRYNVTAKLFKKLVLDSIETDILIDADKAKEKQERGL